MLPTPTKFEMRAILATLFLLSTLGVSVRAAQSPSPASSEIQTETGTETKKDCRRKIAIIVDPYSMAKRVMQALVARGIQVRTIQTSPKDFQTLDPSDQVYWARDDHLEGQAFLREHQGTTDHHYVYNEDMGSLLMHIQEKWGIDARDPNQKVHIFTSEMGVDVAEELAFILDVEQKNDYTKSSTHRNKGSMGRALRHAGFRTIEEIEAKTPEEIIQWARESFGPNYRILMKPTNGCASEGCKVAENDEQVRQFFREITGSDNIKTATKFNDFGERIAGVLAQQIMGDAFYRVDEESYQDSNGTHRKLAAVYKCFTIRPPVAGGSPLMEREELLYPDEIPVGLVDMVNKHLDTLGIVDGSSHSEEWVLDTTKPVSMANQSIAMDIAARMGGGLPALTYAATGFNQFEAAIDAAFDHEGFDRLMKTEFVPKKFAMSVFIHNFGENRVFNLDGWNSLIEELKTWKNADGSSIYFSSSKHYHENGKPLLYTLKMDDTIGRIELLGDRELVKKAYDWIHQQINGGRIYSEIKSPHS